jgi:predicted RNA-binding Zn-ribbon protein involved in translation (DUF1610 family)
MKQIDCPHCGHANITKVSVSKDVVVVLPCPSCSEWIALFRDRVIPLNRRIIQNGTKEEKVAHISEIIVEFLDSGGLSAISFGEDTSAEPEEVSSARPQKQVKARRTKGPITENEVDHFRNHELDRIDESGYFRKYFG